jgi:micrococcal nuclease
MYEYKIIGIPKVIDGDTLDIMFDIGFHVQISQRCRLMGIDAPESRTTDAKEKKYGLDAKQFVETWLKRQPKLWGRTIKDDKYGRMLVEIYADSSTNSLNTLMITEGYAWSYLGETKVKDFAALDARRAAAFASRMEPAHEQKDSI